MKLQQLFEALPPTLSLKDRALIEHAYEVAEKAHAGQVRASGEPYVTHCVAVAQILADLRMPIPVVVAGLLHDTVEDTELTLEDVRRDFGEEVAKLVDGVTKLAQLPRVSKERKRLIDRNFESLRKTFMAMNDDIRVVIIKLADRLHNMRTLHHLPPEKQQRIAQETLEIFAPLANRLGIWKLKSELEDLSFRYTHPEKYKEIAAALAEHEADRERTIRRIIEELKAALAENNIEGEVSGRPKHIYSIFKKMERKGVSFHEIYDWRAVRVIVKDEPTCYIVLCVIHNLWKPIPGEIDDYIGNPKDNLYRSLHTSVIYTDGRPLEVQIRTPEMHEQAEYGIAAHWRYKEGIRHDESYEKQIQNRIQWIRRMMEWQQEVADAQEFVDVMKREVFQERVYCFTPRGDILDLPAGSTPIDFAYRVHTSIGHRCRGARVNGRLVPLDYRLKTGDQVEILTAKTGGPSRDWLNPDLGLVKSASAIQKIKQYFRRQQREQTVAQGRALLEKELKRLGVGEFSQELLARKLGYAKPEDLLYALGTGDVLGRHIATIVLEQEQQEQEESPTLPTGKETRRKADAGEIDVLGTQGMLTRLAVCCNPVPGDPIIGYVTRGRGVTIHRQDCPNILNAREPERKLQVSWGRAERTYPVPIRIIAYDRPGLMRDISTVMTDECINMSSIRSISKGTLATIDLTMEIADIAALPRVLSRVEQLPNVIEAYRPRTAPNQHANRR
ncbi:MAG: bifunctional (p)ppGpp synthetase/guanosine-3',5'-bis(diphosphate) 3'-pyrophosphohydrolase [Anaerolineales bacterium]|nr:bifunctional (p)ppGpp synthetase/guanosine-3',5'-bis(diphosphate) 3'-pyrophosphohydrolase [Anaerolineales bacterium]